MIPYRYNHLFKSRNNSRRPKVPEIRHSTVLRQVVRAVIKHRRLLIHPDIRLALARLLSISYTPTFRRPRPLFHLTNTMTSLRPPAVCFHASVFGRLPRFPGRANLNPLPVSQTLMPVLFTHLAQRSRAITANLAFAAGLASGGTRNNQSSRRHSRIFTLGTET